MPSPLSSLLEGDLESARAQAQQLPPDDAEGCVVLARLALLEGKVDVARAALDRAKDQRATPLRFTRASLQYAGGQRDAALAEWLDIAKSDPKDPESRLAAGATLLRRGRFDEAEALLMEATTLAPERPEAFLSLGRLLLVKGQTFQALEPLGRALELDALNPEVYATLSAALEELGQVDRLVPLLTEALKLLPGHVDLSLMQTHALISLGRLDEALALLQPMRKASPELPALLEEEARVHATAGRFDEALAVLASSKSVTAPQLLLKAMVLEARTPQDLVGARAAYEAAAKLDPQDWRALNNLGLLLSSQGDGAAARAAYDEAVRRTERQEPAPLFNLAVQLARDEATVELAKAAAREVIALGPSAQLDDAQRLVKTLEA